MIMSNITTSDLTFFSFSKNYFLRPKKGARQLRVVLSIGVIISGICVMSLRNIS